MAKVSNILDRKQKVEVSPHEYIKGFLEGTKECSDPTCEIIKPTICQFINRYGVRLIRLAEQGNGEATVTTMELYRLQIEILQGCIVDLYTCIMSNENELKGITQ